MKSIRPLRFRQRIYVIAIFSGLIGIVACNPNAPSLSPAEQNQPPVVKGEQPHLPEPTSPLSEATDMPRSNPNYGNITSKIGITEQVAVAKRQTAEVGPNPALDIKKEQFQFGAVVGAH